MYHTILFDLDGTLLDTLQDLADSTNYALSVHRMPARTLEEGRTFVGNGVGRLIHLAVPEGTPAEEEAACLADFRAHYLLNMENKTAPYPGVPALLEHLQAAGIRTAVVSNKFDGAVKGLCQNYFGDRLPVAIGESQGVARKPAPDTVFRALAERFPGGGICFDCQSSKALRQARKTVRKTGNTGAGMHFAVDCAKALFRPWSSRFETIETIRGLPRKYLCPGILPLGRRLLLRSRFESGMLKFVEIRFKREGQE